MAELAPYAADPKRSLGRLNQESPDKYRTEYQRDRDRIIHSTAFRRLEYKTQVFVNHEGDLFRTRLTHSIEVAQIARTIARALSLNEDLVEAICLAHDLGHTPFGHSGQDELNSCMRDSGGFKHNLQSLRVVDFLEQRYGRFDGLNLCYETREGILKHCAPRNARKLGPIGERFLEGYQPSLEAQIANLADEIAYNNHDVDDGLRSGLIDVNQLQSVAIFERFYRSVKDLYPGLAGRQIIYETIRRIINALVVDLVSQTRKNIKLLDPGSIEDVRGGKPLVSFSVKLKQEHQELKLFLHRFLYKHENVVFMATRSKQIIKNLFEIFLENPDKLPRDYRERGNGDLKRGISDYIAGMTDRFAIKEHQRLC